MQSEPKFLTALKAQLVQRRSRRSRRGMTLMEVMIVIVIILSLMGVLTFGLMTSLNSANESNAELLIGRINQQVVVYKVKRKKLPDSLGDVFKNEPVPSDPWGNEFVYRKGGKNGYDIISGGSDGKIGTSDDIKMSELQ